MPEKSLKTVTDLPIFYSPEFIERCAQLKKDMHDAYVKIGEQPTPRVDASGRKIVEKRPDGKDYIIEAYMRKKLDEHFPGWTLDTAAPLQFLGSEWVVAQVLLCIIDEKLLAFGIIPPIRKFYGVDSVRIQYSKDRPHTPENIIDVGDNCKQAVSAAFKYAINRLTNIGDDIYGKRMDLEGAGSLEDVITSTKSSALAGQLFAEFIQQRHIRPTMALEVLKVKSLEEITDYDKAISNLKEAGL